MRLSKSFPSFKSLHEKNENIFLMRLSYGTFLARGGFMSKPLRLFMLRNHLARVHIYAT